MVRSEVALTYGLNGNAEEGFQLPININGRIAHLNMYVLNDRALTADGARIFLSLDTPRLGTVSVYFTLNREGGLDAVFSAETTGALASLEANADALYSLAQEAGVEISGVQFHG